jgi:carbamoyltransferase
MKPIYVLGLVYSHDSAAVLLKDGVPIVGIQKERLTRVKHDGSIKDIDITDCINYCLKTAGITIKDIKLVVENSPLILYCQNTKILTDKYRHRLIDKVPKVSISHHLAHAYAAFAASPFNESAVLVVDGQGNYKEDLTEDLSSAKIYPKDYNESYSERESIYDINNKDYKLLRKNFGKVHKSFITIQGLGQMYEYASKYIFNSTFDSGKVMGLAPYGKSFKNFKILSTKNDEIVYSKDWMKNLKVFSRKPIDEDFQYCANFALHVQKELESAMLFLVKWAKANSKSKNLCLSGGVALNSVANQKIVSESGFDNVFILPACSDAGIALGCAFYGYIKILQKNRIMRPYSDYLGKKYSSSEILNATKNNPTIQYEKIDFPEKIAAKAIFDGKIIGWFQDGSEFGPRALGNRSILCDPRRKNMKEILNSRVKFREAFRPFAPSALEEYSKDYFDIKGDSPYMLLIPKVLENKKKLLPSITHVDGTARLQTVNKSQNYKYYSLIEEFYKLSKVPIVLNTSFNIRGEPLVETPTDAINCFLTTDMDELFIGDYRVKRRNLKITDFKGKNIALCENISISLERTKEHTKKKYGENYQNKNTNIYTVKVEDRKKTRIFNIDKKQYELIQKYSGSTKNNPKKILPSDIKNIAILLDYRIFRLK